MLITGRDHFTWSFEPRQTLNSTGTLYCCECNLGDGSDQATTILTNMHWKCTSHARIQPARRPWWLRSLILQFSVAPPPTRPAYPKLPGGYTLACDNPNVKGKRHCKSEILCAATGGLSARVAAEMRLPLQHGARVARVIPPSVGLPSAGPSMLWKSFTQRLNGTRPFLPQSSNVSLAGILRRRPVTL